MNRFFLVGMGMLWATAVASAQSNPPVRRAAPTTKKIPEAAPAQPQKPAGPLESQPPVTPVTTPDQDTFESNPSEIIAMACEVVKMLKVAETRLEQAKTPREQASYQELVESRKKELKGVLRLYQQVAGTTLDLSSHCN